MKPAALVLLVLAVTVALAAGAPGSAAAKRASCGSFTAKNGSFHLRVHVYRIHGSVSCRRARSLSRHVIGSSCNGKKLVAGYRCYPGARALHQPSASGFTLKKRRTVIEGRIRSA